MPVCAANRDFAKMPVCAASDVLKFGWAAFQEIHSRVEALSENDDFRLRIERKIKELRQIADELKTSGVEELPPSSRDSFDKFRDSLGKCTSILSDLHSQGALGKFVHVHGHGKQLQAVEQEIENARNSLQLVLTTTILAQNELLKRRVEEGSARVEATVVHPMAGVYQGTSSSKKLRQPDQVDKPDVNVTGNLMVVKWTDPKNTSDQLQRYEVRYDDERYLMVSGEPQKFRDEESSTAFAVSLGEPKVKPGKLYTIQIRAVNKQGPGQWSEATVARFKTGPPNKPRKPSLTVNSPTEVLVEVKKIAESDENGSPVEQCVVEYAEENNSTEWKRLPCPLNARRRDSELVKFAVRRLEPDCTYHFRVKMVNEAGESHPSDAERIVTTQLIPGAPQDLRISSKRTDKSLKIRWKAPDINPQAVAKYEVQIQPATRKSMEQWNTVVTVTKPTKLSANVCSLKTDTKYRFRVRAINDKGEEGEYCESIVGETRFGMFGRVALTTAAFAGGTVGGPMLGAVGCGILAGQSAGKDIDSSAGKAAASTAAGIAGALGGAVFGTLGAPIMGASMAIMSYKKLEGKLDDQSPQSSEDEDADSMLDEVVKMTLKKSVRK